MQMSFYRKQKCCICLNQNCQESTDHQKITHRGLYCLLQNEARRTEDIQQLKEDIKQTFQKVLTILLARCQSAQQQNCYIRNVQIAQNSLINLTRKLQFWHMLEKTSSLKDIQGYILGLTLSKKRMIQLVKALKQKYYKKQLSFSAFQQLRIQLNKFLINLNNATKRGINSFSYDNLFERFSIVLSREELRCRKMIKYNEIKMKDLEIQQKEAGALITQSTILSETQIELQRPQVTFERPQTQQIVFIQNIPMLCNRQLLELSFTNLTDQLLYKYIPAIDKFKKIRELSLRNNSLSETAYLVLFGDHPLLRKLDIRSSNINSSLIPLIKKCSKLEVLYICDCLVQDYHFVALCQCLHMLDTLYCGENIISYNVVLHILTIKQKLRNFSLRKNQIQFSQAQKSSLQVVFSDRNGFFDY